MKKTDFFIVGAPKCGTTALAHYLGDRKDVFVTSPKEPHFFATDLPGYRAVKTNDEYAALFAEAKEDSLWGEASVFHLYSKDALGKIRKFNSEARVIVMLRDPVELVHSFHSQLLYTQDENIADFSDAWRAIRHRRRGEKIPSRCRDPKLLYYDEVAMLGDQMRRLFQEFPREQVLVVFFQDFVTNTAAEFRRVVEFLGLENRDRAEFPRVNPNRRHRSPLAADILFNKSRWLRKPVSGIKSLLGINKFGLLKSLRQLETKYEERESLDPTLREEIRKHYSQDINLLERILDTKLPDWY